MKRFVLEFGVGRIESVKGKVIRPADKMKMVGAMARIIDKNLLDAVSDAGKTIGLYVDYIILKKYQKCCLFWGKTENVIAFKENSICEKCKEEITK